MLLQACGGGGGGGGGSSMMMCLAGQVRDSGDDECRAPENDDECMRLEAMMPVFVGGACRAECGEGQTRNMTTHVCETSMPMPMPVTCTTPTPFLHGDDCFAECPDAAPIPNTSNECEAADEVGDCPTGRRFFHSGACSVACPPAAPIPNSSNECMTATGHAECRMANPAMPIRNMNGACEAAISAAQCMNEHSLMFFHNGACSAACPDAAPIPNSSNECMTATSHAECRMANPAMPIRNMNGACEAAISAAQCMNEHSLMFFHNGACMATCPDAARVSHNGACMATCPDAASVSHNGVCREMCPDAAPETTNNVCRARVAGDCPDARPVFVDGTSPCVMAQSASQCPDDRPFFVTGGSCRAREALSADCTGSTSVLENGSCVATAISPDLLRVANMETDFSVHEHNYNVFLDVSGDGSTHQGNLAFIGGTNRLRTDVTLSANPRRASGGVQDTDDEVQLTRDMTAGNGLARLLIRRNRRGTGTGVTWEPLANQRTDAPTIAANATDRRARPLIADSEGIRIGGGIDWSYPTIALNSADLLDNDADNSNDATGSDTDDNELLNVRAAVVEWNDDTGYYMAGGVFGYDTTDDPRTASSEVVGAFADGNFTDLIDNPFPTLVSSVTYTGHSFGTYATLPAAEGEGNRGFFAAQVVLGVTFDSTVRAMVTGTIDNFLFSGRGGDTDKLGFTAAGQSLLENALRVRVTLTGIADTTNSYAVFINHSGAISPSQAVLEGGTPVQLRGNWGGAFFGAAGSASTPEVPPAFGGTWAASGVSSTIDLQANPVTVTPNTPGTDGFGISFIGTFGAKRGLIVPSVTFDSTLTDPNHAKYVAVAGHLPLFGNAVTSPAEPDATRSSLALGSNGETVGSNVRTDDRVYLAALDSNNLPMDAAGVLIDVGNDGSNSPDLMATSTGEDSTTNDRRRGAGLGTIGNMTTDPEWDYVTRTYTVDGDSNPATFADGDVSVTMVDWANVSDGSYLGGGVWSRYTSATAIQVGAFVDGEDPTGAGVVTAALTSAGFAVYRGHAYGRTSLNNGITGDTNPGFFAAKATLTADFGDERVPGTISGSVDNFLFSKDNSFEEDEKSPLEDVIGGADRFFVILGKASIANGGNRFSNVARGSRIRLPDGELLDPVGLWGGRFYGDPASPNAAPPVVGGVFSVAGATGPDTTGPNPDDVSFSIIGSFGAKRPTQ